MTDHPMFLEYDWTSNTYRSPLPATTEAIPAVIKGLKSSLKIATALSF